MVTGDLEAAGDAITGAMIGRSVEPTHGEHVDAGHGNCLNCGATLTGSHCHRCGQAAHIHRTLAAYSHDLLHGVFHFEGKIWRTLPMLVWRPGALTRRYIHGERARFVSPLALFLFAVFLMFAVVGGLAGEMQMPSGEVVADLKTKTLPEIEGGLKDLERRKAVLTGQIRAANAEDKDTALLDKQRDALERRRDQFEDARDALTGKKWTVTELKTGWPKLDASIDKANANPNLFLYKLQASAYKYSWAIIPLSTPFLWLLFFWRRHFKMYDHAVFVTYSLTFMLFLIVALSVIAFAGAPQPLVPLAAMAVPPLHMYRQLRGAYGISRAGAIVRTIALAAFGIVVLSLYLVLLLLRGVVG